MALTIHYTAGYVWQVNEVVTADKLNLAATPTISLDGSIASTSIADGAVTTAKLADGALSADSTGRAKMADLFLSTAKLADQAVTTAKLADLNVTLAKIAAAVWSGKPVQTASSSTATYSNVSAVIPDDDTIPQITEGTELLTLSFTPLYAGSTIVLEAEVPVSGVAIDVAAALFQDATANAIGAMQLQFGTTTGNSPGGLLRVQAEVAAGSTSARTYRLRVGVSSSNMDVNGHAGARKLGGAMKSWLRATEIAP